MTRLHRRLREREEITEEHIEALTVGYDWWHSFRGPGDNDETELENKRAAWEMLGENLINEWAKDCPFTRPIGFWQFSAPELRRCLTGVHPFQRPEFVAHCEEMELEYPGYAQRVRKMVRGVPCISGPPGLQGSELYESERDYLLRLDLLTDYERELLAQESQTPFAAPADVGT